MLKASLPTELYRLPRRTSLRVRRQGSGSVRARVKLPDWPGEHQLVEVLDVSEQGCALHWPLAAMPLASGQVIEGVPFRVNVMDITAVEIPPAWSGRTSINPGPFQFHADPACARRWMRERGNLFCRKSAVRELMRPIAIPGETPRWGLCDGLHHDDHEFVPA